MARDSLTINKYVALKSSYTYFQHLQAKLNFQECNLAWQSPYPYVCISAYVTCKASPSFVEWISGEENCAWTVCEPSKLNRCYFFYGYRCYSYWAKPTYLNSKHCSCNNYMVFIQTKRRVIKYLHIFYTNKTDLLVNATDSTCTAPWAISNLLPPNTPYK
jgi:hypothetical protein